MSTPNSPGRTSTAAVVFDLGNVLIRWDPHPAVARRRRGRRGDPVPGRRRLRLPGLEPRARRGPALGRRRAPPSTGSHPHWSRHVAAYGDALRRSASPTPIDDERRGAARPARGRRAPVRADQLVRRAVPAGAGPLRLPRPVRGHRGLRAPRRLAKPDPADLRACSASGSAGRSRSASSSTTPPPTSRPPRRAGLDAVRFADGEPTASSARARGLPVCTDPTPLPLLASGGPLDLQQGDALALGLERRLAAADARTAAWSRAGRRPRTR